MSSYVDYDRREFWNGFVWQWLIEHGHGPGAVQCIKLCAFQNGELRISLISGELESSETVAPWMSTDEQRAVVAGALDRLFPRQYAPDPRARRLRRFPYRRGPLSCRHWTGAA